MIESEAVVIGSTSGSEAKALVSGTKVVDGQASPSRWKAKAFFVSLGPQSTMKVDGGAVIESDDLYHWRKPGV